MARTKYDKQIKTVDLDKGLFIVRYVSATDTLHPPIMTISVDGANKGKVGLLTAPDVAEPILWQPGSALVVRATVAARLLLEATASVDSGSVNAHVTVERLTQGKSVDAATGQAAPVLDLSGVRIRAHVAGVGDVVAALNEWIAGPTAPSRIEGIVVEWPDKPAQVSLRYSVKFARPHAMQNRVMETGVFAGTRGQALPLTAVMFEMTGAASLGYQLCVDAAFLGAPTMRSTGRWVALSGPSGREPLVGLRLHVEAHHAASVEVETPGISARTAPDAVAAAEIAIPISEPAKAAGSGKSSSGVRVFRSRPKSSQAPR